MIDMQAKNRKTKIFKAGDAPTNRQLPLFSYRQMMTATAICSQRVRREVATKRTNIKHTQTHTHSIRQL